MRILMTTDAVGGVWTFSRQLATEVVARGHEVTLVNVGPPPSEAQHEWCERMSHAVSTFHHEYCHAPLEWMQDNELAYTGAESHLLGIAEEFRPDVFLSSQYCFGALPLWMPKVVVAHSDVLSWARACRSEPLPQTPWLARYVHLVSDGLDAASAVVAPTLWMLSALEANFTVPPHAMVIPNGRTVTGAPVADKALQAAAAGRFWDEAKNLRILGDLDSPLPIYIAGPVDFPGSSPVSEIASATLLGPQSEEQTLALFRKSSVYLCTSVYEPFGLAPLEAALCGCAVVAHDIPSLREVWGECALFFQDIPSLQAILNKLRDPLHLSAAQQRSFERARIFTAARMADRYINLFERLLRLQTTHARSSAHAA